MDVVREMKSGENRTEDRLADKGSPVRLRFLSVFALPECWCYEAVALVSAA